MSVRALSSEIRQAFRAYEQQMKGEKFRANRGERAKTIRSWGFERVDISAQARALATAQSQILRLSNQQAADNPLEPAQAVTNAAEEDEKLESNESTTQDQKEDSPSQTAKTPPS